MKWNIKGRTKTTVHQLRWSKSTERFLGWKLFFVCWDGWDVMGGDGGVGGDVEVIGWMTLLIWLSMQAMSDCSPIQSTFVGRYALIRPETTVQEVSNSSKQGLLLLTMALMLNLWAWEIRGTYSYSPNPLWQACQAFGGSFEPVSFFFFFFLVNLCLFCLTQCAV